MKRAMNRAPGPTDKWWAAHKSKCGGTFHKIKEPPPKPKRVRATAASKAAQGSGDIRALLGKLPLSHAACNGETEPHESSHPAESTSSYDSSSLLQRGNKTATPPDVATDFADASAASVAQPAGEFELQAALMLSLEAGEPDLKHARRSDDVPAVEHVTPAAAFGTGAMSPFVSSAGRHEGGPALLGSARATGKMQEICATCIVDLCDSSESDDECVSLGSIGSCDAERHSAECVAKVMDASHGSRPPLGDQPSSDENTETAELRGGV